MDLLSKKLKKEEEQLTDKKLSYEEKIPTLVTVWLSLQELLRNSQSKSVDRIIEWAQRHTLNLVLHGDWASQSEALKTKLCSVVEEFDTTLQQCGTATSCRCKKLLEVIKDPWGDATLKKILNDPEKCRKDEELTFFSSENGYIVAMRLKKLCDSRCEDLALRFAHACLRCLRDPQRTEFRNVTTDDQKRYILDIYIALLHKYKRTQEIIVELKTLSLEEGFQLVQRFARKRVELSRIWKHCSSVAELAAKVFMTHAMMKPISESGVILSKLLKAWIELNTKLDGLPALPKIMRRIIQAADSSAHIYVCCEILNDKYGSLIKTFTIELYIRALTTDMNELEQQKQSSNNQKVQETSRRLADGFLSLADILQDHLLISRECVLTSFSVSPTVECMERIESLALASGKMNPQQFEDEHSFIRKQVPPLDTGQSSLKSNSVFSNSELSKLLVPHILGVSEQLCDDLAVVLSGPRYQFLSWVMDWLELKAACSHYLTNAHDNKTVVKELKYLNIDYNQFKDWPDVERTPYCGIEKGYEQFTEDEENSNTEPEYIYDQNFNDSDESVTGVKKQRKNSKIYTSDSDSYSNNRKTDSHSSDLDTASQDADSLGSDGLQAVYNKKNVSTNEKISRFNLIMHNRNQTEPASNTNDNLMSIFSHMDKTETNKPLHNSSLIDSFILPEKRSSDPTILKTLRMFRSNKKRNNEEDNLNKKNLKTNDGCLKTSDGKVIKFPLTPSLNPRVLLDRQDCNNFENKLSQKKSNLLKNDDVGSENKLHKSSMLNGVNMNPFVLLDRYDDISNLNKKNKQLSKKQHNFANKEKKRRKIDMLADVPGLNSLEMIRPSIVQPTVQVVQVTNNLANTQQIRPAKSQSNSSSVTATTSNIVTSTPVTAHIQRVGQPQTQEKDSTESESENVSSNSSQSSNDARISIISSENTVIQSETMNQATTSKPSNSQSTPTLVNILSQQIIRPGQSSTPTRNSALINILSQQIIKPPTTQLPQKVFNVATSSVDSSVMNVSETRPAVNEAEDSTANASSTTSASPLQLQNTVKITTTSSQPIAFQNIFNAQGKNSNQVIAKSVNLVANSSTPGDTTRLVQFLCKTDGKVVHLTPYSANANIKLQTIDTSKLIKTTNSSVVTKQTAAQSVSRSSISSPANNSGYAENFSKFLQRTVPVKTVQNEFNSNTEEVANSLPKFQQAFGKAGYQTTSSAIESPLPSVDTITTSTCTLTSTSVPTTVTNEASTTSKVVPSSQASFVTSTKTTSTTTTVTTKPVISNKSAISPLGVQTIQGSVIYAKHVPVSFSVTSGTEQINLIPGTTMAQIRGNQLYKITPTGEQVNVSKENVIMRNKMSALLAAALQSNVPNRSSAVVSTITSTVTSTAASPNVNTVVTSSFSQSSQNRKVNNESDVCDVDSNSNDSSTIATSTVTVTNTTPTLVTPMRIALPMMQRTPGPNGLQTTRIMRPILQIPQSMIRGAAAIRQQVLLAAATPVQMTGVVTSAPQTQTVPIEENLLTHNNIEPSVSSTTLEQLREFDLVLEQVKERSTVQPNTSQNKVQVVKPPITVNTDLQEVISNVSVAYMTPSQMTQKVTSGASVVVVTSYCNVQPAASPALSVTSQSSSSPCVTPAPSSSGSVGKTVPKASAKSPKSKTVKTTAHTSKTSPIPKPQQKPQEDEQTTQRIFDILAEYAEQLRNSPDLNNKPAPRRRSNPPTNPSQNSKRKKCSSSKKSISVGQCNSIASELSPGTEDPRTMGSEDSCGIVQLSVQNSPQDTTLTDDHQSPQCSSDFSSIHAQQSDTNDTTVETQIPQGGRQFIFSDTNTNQSRNVIITDSAVSEALVGKLSNTAAVIVPANYIVPMVKGGQQIAVVSGSSKILATVPAGSGSNMLLFQSFVNQRKPVTTQQSLKSVKYPTRNIITSQGISQQILSGVSAQTPLVLSPSTETVTLTHPLSFKKITEQKSVITSDKVTGETIIASSAIPIATGTAQKCNVILTSGNVSDINHLTADDSSSAMDNSVDGSEENSKSSKKLECIKILPMNTDSISVENEELNIIQNSEANSLLQNSSFSLNFTSKESSVPVFSQIVTRSPANEKDKNSYLQTKITENESELSSSETKTQHNVIRTIIDSTGSDKIISSNSNIKYQQIDLASSVDYSKIYMEDKKKVNTNGPMLGQSDSDVGHTVMRRDADKVVLKRKLARAMSEGSTFCYHKSKKPISVRSDKSDGQQRKQEVLERVELCLQKSLSEECEDLGVDEPSTSDLFPEADLLFDSNNSPSFDQLSQDIDKKYVAANYQIESSCSNEEDFNKRLQEHVKEVPKKDNEFMMEAHVHPSTSVCTSPIKTEVSLHQRRSTTSTKQCLISKEGSTITQIKSEEKEATVTLFSDDDNSDSTLRTDLLFESLDYPSGETDIDYNQSDKSQQIVNGSKEGIIVQSSASNYSGSSYEEHSLMNTCTSASDVPSPIQYDVNSSPLMHKYKYKYCNRKRLLSAQNTSKSTNKTEHQWQNTHSNNVIEVIKMLSSDEDTSESAVTERAKSSSSRSPSPCVNDRKRSASPTWAENNDESNHSYSNVFTTNKVLKMHMNDLGNSVCSAEDSDVHRKEVTGECTLDCLDSSTPSPLSPDGEESYGGNRSAIRSTRTHAARKCLCCSPEKPRKMLNLKKVTKGQITKKR